MKSKTIVATFIGMNGSCGYQHGKEYSLTIKHDKDENIEIHLSGSSRENFCDYESVISFLNNWKDIRAVN